MSVITVPFLFIEEKRIKKELNKINQTNILEVQTTRASACLGCCFVCFFNLNFKHYTKRLFHKVVSIIF
jgi:hypothetical protein